MNASCTIQRDPAGLCTSEKTLKRMRNSHDITAHCIYEFLNCQNADCLRRGLRSEDVNSFVTTVQPARIPYQRSNFHLGSETQVTW